MTDRKFEEVPHQVLHALVGSIASFDMTHPDRLLAVDRLQVYRIPGTAYDVIATVERVCEEIRKEQP